MQPPFVLREIFPRQVFSSLLLFFTLLIHTEKGLCCPSQLCSSFKCFSLFILCFNFLSTSFISSIEPFSFLSRIYVNWTFEGAFLSIWLIFPPVKGIIAQNTRIAFIYLRCSIPETAWDLFSLIWSSDSFPVALSDNSIFHAQWRASVSYIHLLVRKSSWVQPCQYIQAEWECQVISSPWKTKVKHYKVIVSAI